MVNTILFFIEVWSINWAQCKFENDERRKNECELNEWNLNFCSNRNRNHQEAVSGAFVGALKKFIGKHENWLGEANFLANRSTEVPKPRQRK